MRKRVLTSIILLITVFLSKACGETPVETLTYAVYPYLPDVGYYQQIIENRWFELEPDIKLIRAEWDCYSDTAPEGIDIVMIDAVMRDKIINSGWIQPIRPGEVENIEDIFPFSLEGLTVNGRLYGIPVFLCGNFLIYDQDCEALSMAEHITDLADMPGILVINSKSLNRHQYIIEVMADTLGEANPTVDDSAEDCMRLIDFLAIDEHEQDSDIQTAMAYDSGAGQGYIGFSESIRFLTDRKKKTRIKSVSFSDRENIRRLYVDWVAVTAEVTGPRYEKCLELMNVIAEADVLTALSVQEEVPQYLMLARKTPYQNLAGRFPLYAQMEELAGNEKNHVILTP